MSAALAELSEELGTKHDLRVALVIASALVKSHAGRIRQVADPEQEALTGFFDSETKARAWLTKTPTDRGEARSQQLG